MLAEMCAALGTSDSVISLLERGGLVVRLVLATHLQRLRELTRKHAGEGMAPADACVTWMAEQESSKRGLDHGRHDVQIDRLR